MDQTSINCIINTADQLAKRKGLIRGIDERFAGSVCGLHKYTDECGREWLLVADEGGFSIRQPFAIPSFAASDAYPSDSFQADGPVNQNFWRDTGDYIQSGGSLVLRPGVLIPADLRWFKDASNFSYRLEVDYELDGDSTVVAVIKQNGTARLEGRIEQASGSITAELIWIDSVGASTVLEVVGLGISLTGSMVLSYQRNTVNDTYMAQLQITPTDQSLIELQDLTSINALSDADFGQGSAVRIERALVTTSPSIGQVQGEPI